MKTQLMRVTFRTEEEAQETAAYLRKLSSVRRVDGPFLRDTVSIAKAKERKVIRGASFVGQGTDTVRVTGYVLCLTVTDKNHVRGSLARLGMKGQRTVQKKRRGPETFADLVASTVLNPAPHVETAKEKREKRRAEVARNRAK